MSKVVTIDARWLVGGIGTYTENLLRSLAQVATSLRFHAIARSDDAALIRTFCDRVAILDVPIYTLREQFLVPRAARNCDLLHIPHFNVPLAHRGPLIVSIMDLIHLQSPKYRRSLSSRLYARPMLNLAARKADHIVTVSNYSKRQIVEELRLPESTISVIPCGVSEHFHPPENSDDMRAMTRGLGLTRPYLLYVGNLKPHKNVDVLLLAYAELRKRKGLQHLLLIVGNDLRWKQSTIDKCSRLGIQESVVFAPHIPAASLPAVYAGADLLVLPSTMEGFGLPVIEAMACGTPVVCSNAASLPEVAGEAALFFDPSNHDDLVSQIEDVLNSSDLRTSLRDKGLRRAKRFTWQESAQMHLSLYRQLLGMADETARVPSLVSLARSVNP